MEIYPGYREIEGHMAAVELEWLYHTAKSMHSIIEIGSLIGRSTVALLTGCPGIVYAIDHFEGCPGLEDFMAKYDIFEEFKRNTAGFDNLVICKGSSRDMSLISYIPKKVDMVFIDGAHDYESVRFDLDVWGPRAKKILCGHDYDQEGVPQALVDVIGSYDGLARRIWYKWVERPCCTFMD